MDASSSFYSSALKVEMNGSEEKVVGESDCSKDDNIAVQEGLKLFIMSDRVATY